MASQAACCQADVHVDDQSEAGLTFGRGFFGFKAAAEAEAEAALNTGFILFCRY